MWEKNYEAKEAAYQAEAKLGIEKSRHSEIEQIIDDLNGVMEQNHKLICALQDRLSPVMRSAPSVAGGASPTRDPSSPLGCMLQTLCNAMESQKEILTTIHERLSL